MIILRDKHGNCTAYDNSIKAKSMAIYGDTIISYSKNIIEADYPKYDRISELTNKNKERRSKTKKYLKDVLELKNLVTNALLWESI